MKKQRLIFDAHLDLSMNAMEWNRDLRLPIAELNSREQGMDDKPDRGNATVSFGELKRGNIGLVVATQIARYVEKGSSLPGWYSPEQAWAQTQGQLAWYRAMEKDGHMRMIKTKTDLEEHIILWNDETNKSNKPIGFLLSLEGADSLIDLSYLEYAYEQGLRAVGPAHYGPGRYANGTDSNGRLNAKGIALLREMERLNVILDATHLNDDAFWDAMDRFNGPIWASHNNCRALVNHNRQFSDDMIKILISKKAVIGVALDAWMMVPRWVRGVSEPKTMNCSLEVMANHIDHICQLAGNTNHVGVGSDLDGAFGKEQCPYDLKTIADMQLVFDILSQRGYSEDALDKIAHLNWINFLRNCL
ncbi:MULTISPECIES: dipeptidase [unclassified Sphingobacterium]|uniref:dipeptidase n=1 Tax=unclassified Sphingobacterium TaxID=2609468 RepID=UPI0010431F67|nr:MULTISPECIES: membrane dipeptidase [unclassified Sphingobacterium]MCS3554617.1 membrane dipeptidase [Sphingobacterium sp. JUb21]TCR07607.1 membrane dipeptidase [Sphingobacterium sp. JUb20]